MKKNPGDNKKLPLWLTIGKLKLYTVLGIAAAVIIALAIIIHAFSGSGINSATEERTELSPTQLAAISEIGQWEFLSIEDEELVDTVKKGFFKDSALTRIYFGTLRLGFDMRSVKDNWIQKDRDTLRITLPPITLLDTDFIDEARTQAFFETGSWTDKDRSDLYKRAQAKMIKRCMTRENIRSAEENASRQMGQIFKLMGYKNVSIRFDKQSQKVK